MRPDIFDRIMALPLLRVFQPFYQKHREVLLYLFFGGLTTVVSIASFAFFYHGLSLNELLANVLSWILAVLFAFFTNRVWVFSASTNGAAAFLRQMASFFGGRLATLTVEELLLLALVTWLGLPAVPVKIGAQVVVIVLNYVISKLFVFRKAAD